MSDLRAELADVQRQIDILATEIYWSGYAPWLRRAYGEMTRLRRKANELQARIQAMEGAKR